MIKEASFTNDSVIIANMTEEGPVIHPNIDGR